MRLLDRYHSLSPGQQRLALIVAAALVLGALTMLWVDADRSRARLAAELPQLRASITRLEREAEEVKRLRSQPAVASAGTSAPLASLATNAGGVTGAQVSVLDERRVRLTGADVSFASLLEWLGNARTTHGMRVESAKLESSSPGRVRAELVLTRG